MSSVSLRLPIGSCAYPGRVTGVHPFGCAVHCSLHAYLGSFTALGRPSHDGTGPLPCHRFPSYDTLLFVCGAEPGGLPATAGTADGCMPRLPQGCEITCWAVAAEGYGAALATADISRLATMEVPRCTHYSRMHCEGRLTSAVGRRVVLVRVCVCLHPPRRLGGLALCSTWGWREPGTACSCWGERASPEGRHHAAAVVTPGQVTAPLCTL